MPTSSQIKHIHTLKSLLGLTDDVYQEILASFDATSCKELSSKDVDLLIGLLKGKAIKAGLWSNPQKNFDELDGREDMASAKQLRMLEGMWSNFITTSLKKKGKKNVNKRWLVKKTFRKFLRNKFKVSDLRFLHKNKVSKVRHTIYAMINKE